MLLEGDAYTRIQRIRKIRLVYDDNNTIMFNVGLVSIDMHHRAKEIPTCRARFYGTGPLEE